MPKFSNQVSRPGMTNVLGTAYPEATFEGGEGFSRDAKSELFLLAISNMVSEDTFYEAAKDRDLRFEQLIHQVTKEDAEWMQRFIPWLRDSAQMRSASVVAVAEYVKAGGPNGRQVIAKTLMRGDEPAELLAYWANRHGKRFPMPVKRGVADAAVRLYNEKSALKYDGQSRGWRMGDVVELTHPKAKASWQNDLFKYLLDKRHHDATAPDSLQALHAAELLDKMEPAERIKHRDLIEASGYTWEKLSVSTADAWETLIPQMGYMALLRNLRNFDNAGIRTPSYNFVADKLTNPIEVEKSRQFPFRFLSAYKSVESERWKYPLEQALELSLANVPQLRGRTLIMVDNSGSMYAPMSARSQMQRWEVAAVFGAALAKRAQSADLISYGTNSIKVDFGAGASIFNIVNQIGVDGGGTDTWGTLAQWYSGHERVVIITDEQAHFHYGQSADSFAGIPLIYTFNLAGYGTSHMEAGPGRFTFGGGLTDSAFRVLQILEEHKDGVWPF